MARLKDITFESGSLTGTNGADSALGSITLDSASAVKGTYSARGTAAGDFVREDNTLSDSYYVSALIKITSLPASAQGRVLFIRSVASGIQASLRITSAGKVQLRNSGNTQIGSDSTKVLSTGTIYRIGLRYTKGTGANSQIDAYVVDDGAAWGSPFATSSAEAMTVQVDRVEAGQGTGGTAMDIFFDNIRIDDATLPTDDISGTVFNQSVNVTVSNTPTITKTSNKSISITEGNTASVLKQAQKNINSTVNNVASNPLMVNKNISASVSNITSLTKSINKTITITSNILAAITKLIAKEIAVTVSNAVDIARVFIPAGGTIFTQSVNVVVSNSIDISRDIRKNISVFVTNTVSLRRQILKTIQVSVPTVVLFTRKLIHILQLMTKNVSSLTYQRSVSAETINTSRDVSEEIELPSKNTATVNKAGTNNGEL